MLVWEKMQNGWYFANDDTYRYRVIRQKDNDNGKIYWMLYIHKLETIAGVTIAEKDVFDATDFETMRDAKGVANHYRDNDKPHYLNPMTHAIGKWFA